MTQQEESMLVFAARYAHNRLTGAALMVVSEIIDKWPEISERTRKQLVRESREATHFKDEWQRLADLK